MNFVYNIPEPAQLPPVQRRHPLTNAENHVNHPLMASSPALPRQNPKVTPPSPPKIITDKSGKLQFDRVGFLGEVCVQLFRLSISNKLYLGWLCTGLRSERPSRQSFGM